MRILCVADEPDRAIWDGAAPERIREADLIISCGDLPAAYLEFLVTMASCPLLYVEGNHDGRYAVRPPEGCENIDGKVFTYRGLKIAGLGGSMRYKDGPCMYTEKEMKKRYTRLRIPPRSLEGLDILVTHAPPKDCGDMEDLPHQGFACFNELLDRYHPSYLLHGHVHRSYGGFVQQRVHRSGTRVINCYDYLQLDIPDPPAAERRTLWHLIRGC